MVLFLYIFSHSFQLISSNLYKSILFFCVLCVTWKSTYVGIAPARMLNYLKHGKNLSQNHVMNFHARKTYWKHINIASW